MDENDCRQWRAETELLIGSQLISLDFRVEASLCDPAVLAMIKIKYVAEWWGILSYPPLITRGELLHHKGPERYCHSPLHQDYIARPSCDFI
ncbi:MAG: hypothetical protein ABSG46_04770 [Candidatus Binataceae bacterium]